MHVQMTKSKIGYAAIVIVGAFSLVSMVAGFYVMFVNVDKFPLATEDDDGVTHYTWNTVGIGIEWLYHSATGTEYKMGIDGL